MTDTTLLNEQQNSYVLYNTTPITHNLQCSFLSYVKNNDSESKNFNMVFMSEAMVKINSVLLPVKNYCELRKCQLSYPQSSAPNIKNVPNAPNANVQCHIAQGPSEALKTSSSASEVIKKPLFF